MFFLDQYEEFCPNCGYPSLKEKLQYEPYQYKADILKYLQSGHIHMVTASRIIDVFTGEKTNIELVFMNDGKYSWTSKIPYYVEKYNLRLPKEFEKHILNK